MVRYTPKHEIFCNYIHKQDFYKNASINYKKEIDDWLESIELKSSLNGYVAQLNLHESLVLLFISSDTFRDVYPIEQKNIVSYLNSSNFKKMADDLEERIQDLTKSFIF